MFTQIITMRVPANSIETLRTLITDEYLPEVQTRSGFVSANLLEQVDDRNMTHLIINWETQSDVEAASHTSSLAGSPYSIVARIPGMRVQRHSYLVTVNVEQVMPA